MGSRVLCFYEYAFNFHAILVLLYGHSSALVRLDIIDSAMRINRRMAALVGADN